ncbi:MAG TPA: hypothetical protein VNQ73_20555 [Ilumatobacter sp.]|nr:hypothetical protein [Ilumatobacter sp.]
MFTTGSKLLIGSTLLAGALAALYGVFQGGALGTIGLTGAACGLALLAAVNVFARDSNVSAMDHDAFATAAAAQAPARNSLWPLLIGIGGATLTLGLVTYKAIFMLGVIALVAGALEWLVQAWSERASSDAAYNAGVRDLLVDPVELPVAGAAGAGIVVYAFSRVMLGLPSKSSTVVAFSVIAAIVLAVGTVIGLRKQASKPALTGLFSVAAIALVAGGAFAGLNGQREIHHHETTSQLAEHDECGNEHTHADERASQTVASKSNVAAEVTFDGAALHADVPGFDGDFAALTLPRANPSNIMFRNTSSHAVRLVIDTFDDPEAQVSGPARYCTALVEQGGTGFLTIRLGQNTAAVQAAGNPGYAFVVPGSDAQLEVVVP